MGAPTIALCEGPPPPAHPAPDRLRLGKSTTAKILKDHGIKPAPDRPTSWRTFLKAHWDQFAGADFFTTEVWTPRGQVTFYVLFVIDLRTRKVHVADATPNPDEGFMARVARNLTDVFDGFLRGRRFLICDRDNKFTSQFKRILRREGVDVITTPYQAPKRKAQDSHCTSLARCDRSLPLAV